MKMNRTKMALILILLGLVVLFTLQNTQIVEVRLLFWKIAMSRVLMIFVLLLVGAILGWVGSSVYRHRSRD